MFKPHFGTRQKSKVDKAVVVTKREEKYTRLDVKQCETEQGALFCSRDGSITVKTEGHTPCRDFPETIGKQLVSYGVYASKLKARGVRPRKEQTAHGVGVEHVV